MVRIVFGKINRIIAGQVGSLTHDEHGMRNTVAVVWSADFMRGRAVISAVGAGSQ
jgi:hypothetical protein